MTDEIKNSIEKHFQEVLQTQMLCAESLNGSITKALEVFLNALLNGNKILACGNGGSAGDAQHFASELVNRFEKERPPLPAISLCTDSSTITSIANDYSYDQIYSKQIKAIGKKGDILLGITTSGNSKNIIEAVKVAHKKELKVIIFSGKDGGKLAKYLTDQDIEIRALSNRTARIQEVHLVLIHILCDLIDKSLFPEQIE